MKWWVTLWLGCVGLQVQASGQDCVSAYRSAYIELARTNSDRYREAADLYTVYFDYVSGFTPVENENQRRILEFVKTGMENGAFCGPNGTLKSKSEILDQILSETKK